MLGNLFNPRHREVDTAPDQETPQEAPTAGTTPVTAPLHSQDQIQSTTVGSKLNPAMRQNLSALSHLDVRTTQVLHHAQDEVRRIKGEHIEPTHILLGLLYDEEIFKLLEKFEVDVAKLSHDIQSNEQMGSFTGQPTLSDASTKLFEQAYRDSKARGVSFVTPEDLLLVMCNEDSEVGKVLKEKGVQKEQVVEKLGKTSSFKPARKSVLEQYGIDLTEEARAGKLDPITGRDKEIERLIHILLRRSKNNPVIIGEAGVGKTAIVEGLAQKIVSGEAPSDLHDKRIFQLDLASLVAGASHRGEFEERLKGVINETIASNGQTILFIDEIHTLIGAGDTDGAMDASNIIKPHLARGHMQIIGTTTTSEYRKHFEKDKAFERRFQPIIAEEPSEEVAVEMLKVLRPKYEKFHSVSYPDETLVAAVKLSKKYIGDRYLPDKAVDLLDEAGAEVKLALTGGKVGTQENRSDKKETQGIEEKKTVTESKVQTDETVQTPRQGREVTKEDIQKVVSSWTGIPITKLTEDESAKLLKLEDRIHERLIDQEEAVVAVAEAVRRGRIGLAAANRPIASFIFLGPTGVGKTELAKTLAEILFGRDDALVRLDMSEYMEKHEVAKLIGAPPGYVGYEEGGQLTEAVRAKPYSIVLLDEVEKAHPDVFNILLQLLEDGRLTDNKGNTISFKNTIVIATSNIGSGLIQQQLSEKDTDSEKAPEDFEKRFAELAGMVSTELHKFFRPELLNRFDDVVIFKPLRRQDMNKIAKLSMLKTAKLLQEQGYQVQTTDQALTQLAKEGYDPVYGARPLRRLIQTSIENPIALLLIGKTFVPGDTIVVDYDTSKNTYTFTKGATAAVQNGEKDEKEETKSVEAPTSEPLDQTQGEPIQNLVAPQPQGTAIETPEQPLSEQQNGVVAHASQTEQTPQVQEPQPAYPNFDPQFDPTSLAPQQEEEKPEAPLPVQNGYTNGNGNGNGTYNIPSANGLTQSSGSNN